MSKEELAARLNGIQYPAREIGGLADEAKASGLVIAHGASDDLLEMHGAIREELSAWEGRTHALGPDGLPPPNICDDEDCPYRAKELEELKHWITAAWCPDGATEDTAGDGPSWRITASVPTATFNIMEDDDVFCEAIVFELAALKNDPTKPKP